MISSTAESKAAHRHAALQQIEHRQKQIEHRLTVVLATMANLKVEQDQLRAESVKLDALHGQIINPPPRVPKGEGSERERRNAYMRDYMAQRRAAGKKSVPRDREKYNTYHREYERNKRARLRADGITTQIVETRPAQ